MCIYSYNNYVNLYKQLKLDMSIYHALEADAKEQSQEKVTG